MYPLRPCQKQFLRIVLLSLLGKYYRLNVHLLVIITNFVSSVSVSKMARFLYGSYMDDISTLEHITHQSDQVLPESHLPCCLFVPLDHSC